MQTVRFCLQKWILGCPRNPYTPVPEENGRSPSTSTLGNMMTPKNPTPTKPKQQQYFCVIMLLGLASTGQANAEQYPHQPFRWVLSHLSAEKPIKEIVTVGTPSFEVRYKDIIPQELGYTVLNDRKLRQLFWCPASNPGKSYCNYPGWGYFGYWGCETFVASNRWQPE